MDARTKTRFEARARILKAMAHPTRLFIIDELNKGERCVADLTAMIGADTSTVSRHLSVLRNAGIVHHEKRRSQVFYSLRTPCIVNFFSCIETVLMTAAVEQMETTR